MTEEGVNEATLAIMSELLAARHHVDTAKAVQVMAAALDRVAGDDAIERLIGDVLALDPDDEQDELAGGIVRHLREIQATVARRGEHRCRSGPRCGKDARRRSMTEKREKAPDVRADSTPATVARR